MPSISFFTLGVAALLSIATESKHVRHHGHLHKHARREDKSSPRSMGALPSPATARISAQVDAIQVDPVQSSLGATPDDLLSLIGSMKDNLLYLESHLASIASCTAAVPTTTHITPTSSVHLSVTPLSSPRSEGKSILPTQSPIPSTSTTKPAVSSSVAYSLQPSPPPYTFQPNSKSNVAVYYGTTQATTAGGLLALCWNKNVDIVIISFVFTFFGPQGYPSLNFGPGCVAANSAQASQASGLMDCTALAAEIAGCHEIGKKVLVSLGGWNANTAFDSDAQATTFATTLWNLFRAGTATPSLRPFGTDVVIDGFDIDNENHNTAYYTTFATALRQQFARDPSRKYYLSAAPQCPLPDESIPLGAMLQADWVWVQFYNNPSCNLNTTGFQRSFAAWSQNLTTTSTNGITPRLFIGAAAFAGAGSGYVAGTELRSNIGQAKALGVKNLGGIMLWDGSEGMANVDQNGFNYLVYAKASVK